MTDKTKPVCIRLTMAEIDQLQAEPMRCRQPSPASHATSFALVSPAETTRRSPID